MTVAGSFELVFTDRRQTCSMLDGRSSSQAVRSIHVKQAERANGRIEHRRAPSGSPMRSGVQ